MEGRLTTSVKSMETWNRWKTMMFTTFRGDLPLFCTFPTRGTIFRIVNITRTLPLTLRQLSLIDHVTDPLERRACSFILSYYAHHDMKRGDGWVVLGRRAAEFCHGVSARTLVRRGIKTVDFWKHISKVLKCDFDYPSHALGKRTRAKWKGEPTDAELEELVSLHRRPDLYDAETKKKMSDEEVEAFLTWRASLWQQTSREDDDEETKIISPVTAPQPKQLKVEKSDYFATLVAINADNTLSAYARRMHIVSVIEFYHDPTVSYVAGDRVGSSRIYISGTLATLPGRYRKMLYGERCRSVDIRAHNPSVVLSLTQRHGVDTGCAASLTNADWIAEQAEIVAQAISPEAAQLVPQCVKRFRTELVNAPRRTDWTKDAKSALEVSVIAGIQASQEAKDYRKMCLWFSENLKDIADPHGELHTNANALLTAFEWHVVEQGIDALGLGIDYIRNHDEIIIIADREFHAAALHRVIEAMNESLTLLGINTTVKIT